MTRKSYILLFNFILINSLLLILSFLGSLDFLINGFDFVSKPLSSALKSNGTDSGNFLSTYFNSGKIQSENFNLRKEIISLNEKLSDYNNLKSENDFLRNNANLTSINNYSLILSKVISLNSSTTILIDKGSNDGVHQGDIVVVSGKTVLGRITSVNQFASTVEFVGATRSGSKGISVYSNASGKEVKGFLSISDDSSFLKVNDILKANTVNNGDTFLTTGDDKIYPRDLVVGSVSSITDQDTQTVKSATLSLNYDITSLQRVYILKSNSK